MNAASNYNTTPNLQTTACGLNFTESAGFTPSLTLLRKCSNLHLIFNDLPAFLLQQFSP